MPGPCGSGPAPGGGQRVAAVAEIRDQALQVAAGWSGPGSPESWQLTAALFRLIAGHQELLTALAPLPAGRLPGLLAAAAVCFLVDRDQPEPVARYFPRPDQAQPLLDDGFEPAARAFVSARLTEISGLCRTRRYQMNEVARCTQIALGIAAVAGPSGGEIALVDLGTGAGLGLQLDRYHYETGGSGAGPSAASLCLSCEVRGPRRPPPPELPPLASRTGIEASPVDLTDPAARAWLTACAPPEASARTRLAHAIEVAREHPAPVIAGDVVDELPAVLAALPAELPAVVTDAYLAVFLPPERRARLTEVLAAAARTRPVTWLSLDPLVPLGRSGRDSVQDLRLPGWLIDDYQRRGVFAVLGARNFGGAEGDGLLLARSHPSGQWVEWLMPAR